MIRARVSPRNIEQLLQRSELAGAFQGLSGTRYVHVEVGLGARSALQAFYLWAIYYWRREIAKGRNPSLWAVHACVQAIHGVVWLAFLCSPEQLVEYPLAFATLVASLPIFVANCSELQQCWSSDPKYAQLAVLPVVAAGLKVVAVILSIVMFFSLVLKPGHLLSLHVFFLRPGETPPEIPRQLATRSHHRFFAVRITNWMSSRRYLRPMTTDAPYSGAWPLKAEQLTSLGLVSRPATGTSTRFDRLAGPDYWSIIRFAIADLLDSSRNPTTRKSTAGRFSVKFHLFDLKLFLTLVLFVTIGAISGLAFNEKLNGTMQFAFVCGFLGIGWALWAIVSRRIRLLHLLEWEQRCRLRPFMDCPIFMLRSSSADDPSWHELDGQEFASSIRNYGLDSSTLLQFAIGLLLVALLTLLQLIK